MATDTVIKKHIKLAAGGIFEFEEFEVIPGQQIWVMLPPVSTKQNARNDYGYIGVNKKDYYDVYERNCIKEPFTNEELLKTRVGVLLANTQHPFPRGLYIMYRVNSNKLINIVMNEATGEFVKHDTIK